MHSTGRFKYLKTPSTKKSKLEAEVFNSESMEELPLLSACHSSSCIQDWQIPISFNICKPYNCTQLHSLKTSHSLPRQSRLFFFLPASISPHPPIFSKQKGWEEQSSDFIHVITAPKKGSHQQHCPTVITILKTNQTKSLATKRVPVLKSFQPKCYR